MKRPWGIVPHALVLFPSAETVSTPATKTFLSSCVYALPSGSPLSWSRLHGILHSDRFRATQIAAPGRGCVETL
jgi:hypothetical protein